MKAFLKNAQVQFLTAICGKLFWRGQTETSPPAPMAPTQRHFRRVDFHYRCTRVFLHQVQEESFSEFRSGLWFRVCSMFVANDNTHTRWWVLILASFLMFGNFFAYDVPASLSIPLQQHLGQSDGKFQYTINILYSMYSIPNIILPFFSGYIIDRFGSSRVTILLAAIVLLGQYVFACGVAIKSSQLMYFGRMM